MRKMQGENANRVHNVYKAMVVQHISERILGIPSLGYPGKKSNVEAHQILSSITPWPDYYFYFENLVRFDTSTRNYVVPSSSWCLG